MVIKKPLEVIMIKIIYGPKGTGKTKIMIDEANAAVASAKDT